MKKEFPIPHLDQESWEGLQASLDSIGRLIRELQDTELNPDRRKKLELAAIHMGLVDVYLGREYTLDEVKENFKKTKKDKQNSLYNEAKMLFNTGNEKIWILCCDPNLGDYFTKYVTQKEFKQYEHSIMKVFSSTYDMHKYINDNNIII